MQIIMRRSRAGEQDNIFPKSGVAICFAAGLQGDYSGKIMVNVLP
jgi:hypothetical protein